MTTRPVSVLLATYNGEKYLEEQLESLASQAGVELHLLVSDDGSTDNTQIILKSFANQFASFSMHRGPQRGHSENFSYLMRLAPGDRAIAFCDQDDVWFPNKLIRALDSLRATTTPTLYFSLVQAESSNLPVRFNLPAEASFFANCAMGCTQVLNPQLVNEIRPLLGLRPRSVPVDWWIWFLSVNFFQVTADPKPSMTYRIHSGQTIGVPPSWARYSQRFVNTFRIRSLLSLQTRDLLVVLPKVEKTLGLKSQGHEMADAKTLLERLDNVRKIPPLGRNSIEGQLVRFAYLLSRW